MGVPLWIQNLGDGGRYNEEAEELVETLEADGVILIVVNGNKGEGATIKIKTSVLPSVRKALGKALIETGKDLRREAFGSGTLH